MLFGPKLRIKFENKFEKEIENKFNNNRLSISCSSGNPERG